MTDRNAILARRLADAAIVNHVWANLSEHDSLIEYLARVDVLVGHP